MFFLFTCFISHLRVDWDDWNWDLWLYMEHGSMMFEADLKFLHCWGLSAYYDWNTAQITGSSPSVNKSNCHPKWDVMVNCFLRERTAQNVRVRETPICWACGSQPCPYLGMIKIILGCLEVLDMFRQQLLSTKFMPNVFLTLDLHNWHHEYVAVSSYKQCVLQDMHQTRGFYDVWDDKWEMCPLIIYIITCFWGRFAAVNYSYMVEIYWRIYLRWGGSRFWPASGLHQKNWCVRIKIRILGLFVQTNLRVWDSLSLHVQLSCRPGSGTCFKCSYSVQQGVGSEHLITFAQASSMQHWAESGDRTNNVLLLCSSDELIPAIMLEKPFASSRLWVCWVGRLFYPTILPQDPNSTSTKTQAGWLHDYLSRL